MMTNKLKGHLLLALGAAAVGLHAMSAPAQPPAGFADTVVATGLTQPVGVAFLPDGRSLVWEKGGIVRMIDGGVVQAAPVINIAEEVGDWRDYGLLGFAIDPAFATTGYVYLSYVVDYHHARYFGTGTYNAGTNEYFRDTIGRVTRYQLNSVDNFRSVVPGSRLVLIGESLTTGIPHCHQSHGIGSLAFGDDGTLIVGAGDGASYEEMDNGGPRSGSSNTALGEGIITAAQNVGAFRAQLLDSHCGKMLRIDPATGNGVPSNPFYNAGAPRSARSRVWAMGFRNPFRFSFRPGTGNPSPAAADPGTLYIGDVGWTNFEELNVVTTGGLSANCGWPIFEGYDFNFLGYPGALTDNQSAANPLAGGSCPVFFDFQNLIVQATLAAPSWPNPCNGAQQVPPAVGRFMHLRPAIDWGRSGPFRCGSFSGNTATIVNVGAGAPVIGGGFSPGGSSATGGDWYEGAAFPAAYQNSYYMAEFTAGWIHQVRFNAADQPTEVRSFATGLGGVVDVEYNPSDQSLYYLDIYTGSLRRISFGLNSPPAVVATPAVSFGQLPLTVNFSSAGTTDPEGDVLSYSWNFGDGTPPATTTSPSHTFATALDITPEGVFAARVLSFTPPNPTGTGNTNPQVLRNGDWPPMLTVDPQRQYDTFHDNAQGSGADSDWIGYTFPGARRITRVHFQEGMHFVDGGWFENVRVQALVSGAWADVTGVAVSPAYPASNDGESFEVYTFTFAPVLADGVRLIGNAGGTANFMSIGEFRVFEEPLPPIAPRRYDVTLRVTDTGGLTAARTVLVSGNNTPPDVTITSPVDGSFFGATQFMQPLRATIVDAEHGPGQYTCAWQVALYHNTHQHREPIIADCGPDVLIDGVSHQGETYFWGFALTVTDAHGLSTTRESFIYPQPPDCNDNGVADAQDIAGGTSDDCNENGVPDECDVSIGGGSADCDDNGEPDECAAGVITMQHFDDGPAPFMLNGAAAWPGAGSDEILLTPALGDRLGSIVRTPLRAAPLPYFEAAFEFRVGAGSGADGFAFAALDDASHNTNANWGEEGPGFAALVVSFDTYDNGGEGENVIEAKYNGVSLGTYVPSFDIEDNQIHDARVRMTPRGLTVEVSSAPGVWEVAFNNRMVPGYGPAVRLFGFDGRTGGLTNEHSISHVRLVYPTLLDRDFDGVLDSCQCRANFNGSAGPNGGVSVQDLFDFLGAYFGGSLRADFSGDAWITVQDIFDYLAAYFTPCI